MAKSQTKPWRIEEETVEYTSQTIKTQYSGELNKQSPRGYKHFIYSTQLSITFQLLIKSQMMKSKDFSCFKTLRC